MKNCDKNEYLKVNIGLREVGHACSPKYSRGRD
jgi:hypothetical protein